MLPALHRLAVALPEVGRQRQHAGVQQVAVLERLVVEVVLGRQAQRTRLDAHVDVLRHQHDIAPLLLFAQRLDDAEDLVVGLALRQADRQVDVDQIGLEVQLAAGFAVTGLVEGQTVAQAGRIAARHVGGERVEVAADLARIARDLGHPALVAVELLERDHRQVDVVLVEAEQRRRVVHQHVGVEHEQRRRAGAARLLGRMRRRRHRPAQRRGRLGQHRCLERGSDGGSGRRGVVQLEDGRQARLIARPRALRPLAGLGRGLRDEIVGTQQRRTLRGRLWQRHGSRLE